ncbi:AraC family transcriptional regulator [Pseudomonas sp. UL073]|uniref:AraC family transcriptional regulator n=1 Tax=Zestomonas insulae TaxID=2809017 RepID=A0ABS2IIY8_9GAMM|nr:AraC family transcriptional regulator [Pseudomonas insulae]MBM7061927.1 AraC family transcriptional regulator [Pseudomonas insulae]
MIFLTRAASLHGYQEFAISQQLEPARMLREVGLPEDVLEHPDSLIAYHRFTALINLSAKASGNPAFGLQFGLHQGVGVFGSLLYLARNTQNVGEALHDLSRYYHVHSTSAEVALQRQGEYALLGYSTDEENLRGNSQISELAMGVGLQLMRTLLGTRWQPEAVLFQHAPLSAPAVYQRLLGVKPRFNCDVDAWMFDAKLLDIPLDSADRELHRLIQQHLDIISHMDSRELPGYVQQLMRKLLPSGRVTIEYIADVMRLSPRTLQRHLAAEGTSFQQLLEQTRQAMTVRYMKESDISLIQLTEILGYTDQSTFTRAFQRWFGASPREWMKQQDLRRPRRINPRR